jgi:hypothetical protein
MKLKQTAVKWKLNMPWIRRGSRELPITSASPCFSKNGMSLFPEFWVLLSGCCRWQWPNQNNVPHFFEAIASSRGINSKIEKCWIGQLFPDRIVHIRGRLDE